MKAKQPVRWLVLAWWQVAVVRWSALAVLLAIYAMLSLEPFDWRFPDSQNNGAVPLAEGWSFPTSGIVFADPPLDGLPSAARTEALEISLEVRPLSSSQSGPARILTISSDAYRRNLTLAQEGGDLVLRLRTQETGGNGLHKGRPVARLTNLFEAGRWVAIEVRLKPGRLTMAIDGEVRLAAALPRSVLGTWDRSFGLALGNEMTCNRPWLGEIRKVVIAGPDGATNYTQAERVEVPAACRIMRHPPKLVPLHPFDPDDALRNTLMYLPLGCLFGLMTRRRSGRRFGALVVATAGVSLGFEAAQLFLVSRFPSVDDLIFNALGGALGLGLGFWLMSRLEFVAPDR